MSEPNPSPRRDLPAWYTRRNIEVFTLSDSEVAELIDACDYCTVAWVTRSNEPVQAAVLFTEHDGHICITGTTNRAKYRAWKRNPAASLSFVHPSNMALFACLRGRMELIEDPDELEAFVRSLLGRRGPVDDERWATEWAKFNAPDRVVMRFHQESMVSHNLAKLGWAEATGTDVWSQLEQGVDPFPEGLGS